MRARHTGISAYIWRDYAMIRRLSKDSRGDSTSCSGRRTVVAPPLLGERLRGTGVRSKHQWPAEFRDFNRLKGDKRLMMDAASIAKTALIIIRQMHELRRPKFLPSEGELCRMVKDVFWASLDKYEGIPLEVRLFYAPVIPGPHTL